MTYNFNDGRGVQTHDDQIRGDQTHDGQNHGDQSCDDQMLDVHNHDVRIHDVPQHTLPSGVPQLFELVVELEVHKTVVRNTPVALP